jgi:hypothetical protein
MEKLIENYEKILESLESNYREYKRIAPNNAANLNDLNGQIKVYTKVINDLNKLS